MNVVAIRRSRSKETDIKRIVLIDVNNYTVLYWPILCWSQLITINGWNVPEFDDTVDRLCRAVGYVPKNVTVPMRKM